MLIFQDPTQDPNLISTTDGAPINTSSHNSIESNTEVVHNYLAQTLKEFDDDDDNFVKLEKALGEGSISTISSTKTPSTESGTKTIDIPIVKLLLKCYDII